MALTMAAAPTVYNYYTEGGISAGLSDNQSYFTLNNKNITIYSGAFHYFRVPRAYWRDRLKKMRAAGLNAVETYVPWNLHEPQSGVYDFGEGGSDMEDFLHVEEFLKTAQEEDLLALLRPGPYICSEWDLGGIPSWVLRNTTSVRNSKDENWLSYFKRYFNVLLPILAALQFQKGGPIIGFQIENEYGNIGVSDPDYLRAVRQSYLDNGLIELFYTSDPPGNGIGALPGVLQTANFNVDPIGNLNKLNTLQSGKPTMVMEYWTGTFDRWMENHSTVSVDLFTETYRQILEYPSSVNMYMFVGSTSFGFLSGASLDTRGSDNSGFHSDINSYDYDAPLTEYGGYTDQYKAVKELITSHNPVLTNTPEQPEEKPLVAYVELKSEGQLLLSDVLEDLEKIGSTNIISMELLPINNNSGQSFGYILYRKEAIDLPANAILTISGYVRDTVLVLVNRKLVSSPPRNSSDISGFGFWKQANSTLTLTKEALAGATLDLIVENFSRNTCCDSEALRQFKGLTGDVLINNGKITDWKIAPLEFKKSWNKELIQREWTKNFTNTISVPAFYRFTMNIDGDPQDTYLDMRDWNKGIIIVNGFVLGRHFFVGPQQSSYLPAPLLKTCQNDIIVFEHYNAANSLKFSAAPIWGGPSH